jgi:hypothetical protein
MKDKVLNLITIATMSITSLSCTTTPIIYSQQPIIEKHHYFHAER